MGSVITTVNYLRQTRTVTRLDASLLVAGLISIFILFDFSTRAILIGGLLLSGVILYTAYILWSALLSGPNVTALLSFPFRDHEKATSKAWMYIWGSVVLCASTIALLNGRNFMTSQALICVDGGYYFYIASADRVYAALDQEIVLFNSFANDVRNAWLRIVLTDENSELSGASECASLSIPTSLFFLRAVRFLPLVLCVGTWLSWSVFGLRYFKR